MEQNIFLQKYFKTIYYLYQLKSNLVILVALLGLIRENLMEFQKINITKSDSNSAPIITRQLLSCVTRHIF